MVYNMTIFGKVIFIFFVQTATAKIRHLNIAGIGHTRKSRRCSTKFFLLC